MAEKRICYRKQVSVCAGGRDGDAAILGFYFINLRRVAAVILVCVGIFTVNFERTKAHE